jgi:DNA-binding CsgD family transcriptional regulator
MNELALAASKQPYVNPFFTPAAVSRLLRDGVASEEGCVDPSSLRRTDFYADILMPFDIFHSFGFLLEQGKTTFVISISRSHRCGYYRPHELQLAQRLLPHLRNVHAIQKALAESAVTGVVDRFAWALSADGHVCGRNHHLAGFLPDADPCIGERDGRLWPVHPQDRVALQTEINGVLAGDRLSGRAPIRDRIGTPRYIAHIRHCRREAFLTWLLTAPPAVLVVLQPLDCDPAMLEPVLIRLYGLTPVECRVAAKLLELESIRLVAVALARSDETIRSHIKAVFAKTGTHSQAQLLKLLYALSQR